MSDTIDITTLDDDEKQALVCMYFAKLPSSAEEYNNRRPFIDILVNKFGKSANTYKNYVDAFDYYFTENNRRGWNPGGETLRQRCGVAQQNIYDKYKDKTAEELEQPVKEIIKQLSVKDDHLSVKDDHFIAMKCGIPKTVHEIQRKDNEIVIDGVYTLKDELTINKIVFVTLGGDVAKSDVDWQPGFFGIAHVIKEPYDFDDNGRYFKFNISMDCTFKRAYKREDFMTYIDAFDATYIGPELSRDPSQAISSLPETKAVAVIRAIIDQEPKLIDVMKTIFSEEFINKVMGTVRMFVPIEVEYGRRLEKAVKIYKNDSLNEYVPAPCQIVYTDKLHIDYPYNRIVFGAPGTGKSFKLQEDVKACIKAHGGEYERVTFHPDYTYSQFVGAYKPVSKAGTIEYKFVPGPFLRVYVEAMKSIRTVEPKPYILLIEEINRARVAAVFGDVFQLLDRGGDGVSTYPIQTSEDVRNYLAEKLGGNAEDYKEIRLPNNMFIWATMNSADQGVFPMDTAFKRRWNFEYINIDDAQEKLPVCEITIGAEKYSWNDLRRGINNSLLSYGINEDKLLGPFFLSEETLKNAENDSTAFNEIFKSKVIMYLFEDVMKMRPGKLFKKFDDIKLIYSNICTCYDKYGIGIFTEETVKEIKRLKSKRNTSTVANQVGTQQTTNVIANQAVMQQTTNVIANQAVVQQAVNATANQAVAQSATGSATSETVQQPVSGATDNQGTATN